MPLNAGEAGVPANGSAWASSVLLLRVAAWGKGMLFLVPVVIFAVALSVLNWEVSRLRDWVLRTVASVMLKDQHDQ